MKLSTTLRNQERLERRKEYQTREAQMRRVRRLAPLIQTQTQLNKILLDVPHRLVRREVYELIRPLITKFDAQYPEEVSSEHSNPYDPITREPTKEELVYAKHLHKRIRGQKVITKFHG